MRADDTVLLNARTPEPVPVGRMGFGAAPLGNPLRGLSEEEAQSTLRAAYACGLRFFDTAPLYGLGHFPNGVSDSASAASDARTLCCRPRSDA